MDVILIGDEISIPTENVIYLKPSKVYEIKNYSPEIPILVNYTKDLFHKIRQIFPERDVISLFEEESLFFTKDDISILLTNEFDQLEKFLKPTSHLYFENSSTSLQINEIYEKSKKFPNIKHVVNFENQLESNLLQTAFKIVLPLYEILSRQQNVKKKFLPQIYQQLNLKGMTSLDPFPNSILKMVDEITLGKCKSILYEMIYDIKMFPVLEKLELVRKLSADSQEPDEETFYELLKICQEFYKIFSQLTDLYAIAKMFHTLRNAKNIILITDSIDFYSEIFKKIGFTKNNG